MVVTSDNMSLDPLLGKETTTFENRTTQHVALWLPKNKHKEENWIELGSLSQTMQVSAY